MRTDTLTCFETVRFRAAQGEAIFFDPFNRCMVDNSEHTEDDGQGGTKGTWVTLEAGTEVAIVAAYGKGSTYCLVVNESGDGLKSDRTYGLVVRELSMKKLLGSVLVDVEAVEDESAAA